MIYWHEYNPWSTSNKTDNDQRRLVYITERELRALIGDSYTNQTLGMYTHKIDAYLLKGKLGWISCGIRYGREEYQYLSPHVRDQDLGAEIYLRHLTGKGRRNELANE